MTDRTEQMREALREARDLLEKKAGERGHGCSYTARELHPAVFARIDAALTAPAAEVPELPALGISMQLASGELIAGYTVEQVRALLAEQSTRLRGGVPSVRAVIDYLTESLGNTRPDGIVPCGAEAVRNCIAQLTAAPQAPALDADPLQGAANWIVSATSYDRATHIAEIQQRLLIGYNRASRLYDAAMSAQGGGK